MTLQRVSVRVSRVVFAHVYFRRRISQRIISLHCSCRLRVFCLTFRFPAGPFSRLHRRIAFTRRLLAALFCTCAAFGLVGRGVPGIPPSRAPICARGSGSDCLFSLALLFSELPAATETDYFTLPVGATRDRAMLYCLRYSVRISSRMALTSSAVAAAKLDLRRIATN